MICGISSLKITSGSSCIPWILDTIERCGMIPYPAPMEKSAAPTDDIYAPMTATPNILDAFLPSFVIDGAINPIIISGTQNVISCPSTYLTVTTIFITSSFAIRPTKIPMITPRKSRNGRLLHIFFTIFLPHRICEKTIFQHIILSTFFVHFNHFDFIIHFLSCQ